MSRLHTWAGLVVGWVLFFVFLTGTFGYVNAEVDLWMRPELSATGPQRSPAEMLSLAERQLRAEAPDAQTWRVGFPAIRGNPELMVRWRARPDGSGPPPSLRQEILDPASGLPTDRQVRETGGGETLYIMHYVLHYMPRTWGIYVVGICTMFMLVAILSGIVAHRRIFRDFFTFRSAKGPRSWLDAHNLLGVTALPFHLMITWTGLLFFVFTYMPAGVDALYPGAEQRATFRADAYGLERIERGAAPAAAAALVPLASLLPVVDAAWGTGKVEYVRVDNPGRADARVVFLAAIGGLERGRPSLIFDGVAGDLLGAGTDLQTAVGRFNSLMLALHEGRFADPVLRALYVVAGLAGTAMIATGLVLWSVKRKAKLAQDGAGHFGLRLVDALNGATIIGLPIGIAGYFWANRLLPLDLDGRAAWEVHAMFIVWAATVLVAIGRPATRAWVELCWLAAAAYGLLPLVNALTTARHLGATIPVGDWVMAGFDLSALAAAWFFAALGCVLQRRRRTAVARVVDPAPAAAS